MNSVWIILILTMTQFSAAPPIQDTQAFEQEFEDGLVLFYHMEYDEAIRKFNRCLEYDRNDTLVLLYTAHAYYHLEDYEQADTIYGMIEALSEEDIQKVLFNRAVCHLKMNDREGAYTILHSLLDVYPTNHLVHLFLGDLYFEDEDYLNALANYQRFLELFPEDREAGYAHYHIAYILFEQEKYLEAAHEFMSSLPYMEEVNKTSELFYNQGLTLERLHNVGESTLYYTRSEDMLFNGDRTYKPLIKYRYYYQDFRKVLEYAKQALETRVLPESWFYFIIGVCYTNLYEPTQAIRYLSYVDRDSDDVTTFQLMYYLGANYFNLQLYANAEEAFNLALNHQPGHYQSLAYLTTIHIYENTVNEAISVLSNAIQSTQNVHLYKILALAYAYNTQYQESLDALEQYLQYNAQDIIALLNKGFLLIMLERYDQATPHLTQFTQSHPEYWEAFYMLGWIAHSEAEYATAKTHYLKSAELCGNRNYYPYLGLSCIFAIEGNLDQTLHYLEQAKNFGFSSGALLRQEASYDRIRGQARFMDYVKAHFPDY